ncbi:MULTISPECIES: NAD-dependent succinate-semialdehyde dehydrogenase [Nocardioides]|uniref:NAD-dependent succinate-semialdehyde dehydrogenase n=1 Tax=Nocardioides vastitatis TaxID=2568655 RepID=A0ABW0ZKN0_9ACTN|nr:NAD-dependent succinate-semialdehyde dehydrogenase [Nocardioides sp.]THI92757.1 NAD-dependent succinate-semialdehyde dehydrogenase [Nocardioides sp.]
MTAINDLVPHRDLWIGGEHRPGADRIPVMNPSTGEILTDVANADVTDMMSAVGAAHATQPTWAATAPRQRAEILRRSYELMIERADDLALVMSLEMGKTRGDAEGEVAYAAEFFRWFSEQAAHLGGEFRTSPAGATRILTSQRPVGPALLVTPWNFPAAMATRKIAPALAAGCTVVLKPAAETPLTALMVAEILATAGTPPGVVNVVPTDQPGPTVEAALGDPRIRKLSFTGSTAVGRNLLRLAASNVTRTSMELGGNAPFLVLPGADVNDAVDGAMLAKMRNGGQACTAANRFIVHRSLADAFTEKLAARMKSVRIGSALDAETQLGPMITARAVAGIQEKVNAALDHGAGSLLPVDAPGVGYFHPATVLTDVAADNPILDQEVFGPVAPIVVVDDEDEAVVLANNTEAGLAAYVYASLPSALRVAEQIESGMIGINRGLVSDAAAPFGGMKQSGLGREGGREGISEYLEISYLSVAW